MPSRGGTDHVLSVTRQDESYTYAWKTFSSKRKRHAMKKGRLSTTAVVITIFAGLAAIIGVVWTIFKDACPPPPPPGQEVTQIFVSAYSDPANPPQYSKVLIHALVTDQDRTPLANASITAVAQYKTTKTTKTGMTNSQGECVLEYKISGATVGYPVNVTVEASHNGLGDRASTSFTPKSKYQ